jgi:Fic family protein
MTAPYRAVLLQRRLLAAHAPTSGITEPRRNVAPTGRLRFVGKLTSSKWAKIAKCSQDTALRDIDALLQRGVLVKEAAGGRSTSYVLAA